MIRTIRTALLLLASLGLLGCIGTPPAPEPSTDAEPTGFIRMQPIDTFFIDATRPYVKRLDEATREWVTLVGDAGDVQHLPAGSHKIGLVYSVAPPIIAWPKMGAATPKPEHQLQVTIPKDGILLRQYTIKPKAGGFAWDLTLGEASLVIPSRNHPNAFTELHALLASSVENDAHDQFRLALEELERVADARSIPRLETLLAANPLRRILLKRAIKRIRKRSR